MACRDTFRTGVKIRVSRGNARKPLNQNQNKVSGCGALLLSFGACSKDPYFMNLRTMLWFSLCAGRSGEDSWTLAQVYVLLKARGISESVQQEACIRTLNLLRMSGRVVSASDKAENTSAIKC